MSKDRVNRIVFALNQIREELVERLRSMDQGEFEWVPRPGMKSAKDQIREVVHMEIVCIGHAKTGETPDWETAVEWTGDDVESHIAVLEKVRGETLEYLQDLSDEDLDKHVELPEKWKPWWETDSIAIEEFARWVARHEYYHIGQITTHLWTLGKNPYETAG